MSFKILGTGMYVPPKVVTNDEIAQFVDTSDEWIQQRVGVAQRHVCTEETTVDLAAAAAERALQNAGVTPEELDLILCATVSGENAVPSLACLVQERLGATCMAYDINAACSAFLFLLETAAGYFARGKARRALVIGAERMSSMLDWSDRSTCVIFGDGAGAAVLEAGDGYLDAIFHVRGGDSVIKLPHGKRKSPFSTREEVKSPTLYMKGQETFKFAVNAMCQDTQALLDRNGLTPADIRYIVPHQANARIIDLVARRLGMPMEKFIVNIQRYGNTSGASIPIALDELNRAGKLERGDLVLMAAFGGGLASAATLIRW